MRFLLSISVAILVGSAPCAYAAQQAAAEPENQTDAKLHPKHKLGRRYIPGTSLTEDTLALARMLKITEDMEELKRASKDKNNSTESQVKLIGLRQKCQSAIQFAALELEEALANIDGDLTYTQLEYSLNSAKFERSTNLNNTATFLSAGTLGVLDSSSGIKYAAPVPNIFGITGNALSVAIPLWGLRPRKYKSMQDGKNGNMLAPIFDLPYEGAGYDPIVWKYLNTAALDENEKSTRREALLARWQKFRDLSMDKKKDDVRRLSGFLDKNGKVTLDLLKTRTELLVELRAEVQSMYADLSDLNSEIVKY